MDTRNALSLGEEYHRAGDLLQAEQLYRGVLRADPANAQAWYVLGALCQATGRSEEAISSLRQAIQLRPSHAATWNLLGVVLALQGRPVEAEACFQRVLQIQPGDPEATGNLAKARQELTRTATATTAKPVAQSDTQWPPDSYEACYQRGYDLRHQGRYAEAEAWYYRALKLRPDSADLLNNIGTVLVDQARTEEAATYFRRAMMADPNHFLAHANLAAVVFDQDRPDEAEAAARRAVRIKPDQPMGYNNLGIVLAFIGRLTAAEESYREALRLDPDYAEAHSNLGNVLLMQGRPAEALVHHERALQLQPDYTDAHSNAVVSRQYISGVSLSALADAHADWDRQHAAPLRSSWHPYQNDRDSDRPLRIGFVSWDLRRHPVGYFLVRALEGLRALDCETFCYATCSIGDDLTERLAAASGTWRQARRLTDQELADQIRSDRIDLLFDLAGHTSHNRLLTFARKPAPVQLTWIGYVGTTGLSAIEYLIADRFHVPEGSEAHYRERIIRLPDGYVCYDPPDYAPAVGPVPTSAGEPVTFGSFNNPSKIGPEVIRVWAEILRRLPRSRILLKYKGLDDKGLRRRYLDLFSTQGVNPGRVHMEGWSSHPATLATYRRVDVALDTFPYSGGLTTCEALWMGVPVVTCPGEKFAGRHSLSHLSNVGLIETIARDLAQYVEVAVGIAQDVTRLGELRMGLRERMTHSPLCDGNRFARNLLDSLRTAWHAWCASQLH